jgi:hypothetical protein
VDKIPPPRFLPDAHRLAALVPPVPDRLSWEDHASKLGPPFFAPSGSGWREQGKGASGAGVPEIDFAFGRERTGEYVRIRTGQIKGPRPLRSRLSRMFWLSQGEPPTLPWEFQIDHRVVRMPLGRTSIQLEVLESIERRRWFAFGEHEERAIEIDGLNTEVEALRLRRLRTVEEFSRY